MTSTMVPDVSNIAVPHSASTITIFSSTLGTSGVVKIDGHNTTEGKATLIWLFYREHASIVMTYILMVCKSMGYF